MSHTQKACKFQHFPKNNFEPCDHFWHESLAAKGKHSSMLTSNMAEGDNFYLECLHLAAIFVWPKVLDALKRHTVS
jgi:hypothetical protein